MEHNIILDELFKLLQKHYPTLVMIKHPSYTNNISKSEWIEVCQQKRIDICVGNGNISIWYFGWVYIPLSDPDCFKKFLDCIKIMIYKLKDFDENFTEFDAN